MDEPLPAAFKPAGETNKLLAKAKTSLSKKFKWTRSQALFDAVDLALLCHLFGRDDEALEICRALGRIQFNGNHTIWGSVELALALQARLVGKRKKPEAEACRQRILKQGLAPERLKGILLDQEQIADAVRDQDVKFEQALRLSRALELNFISQLGGSKKCPVVKMEKEWAANLKRLKELTGAND